jgi:hypothetical protein
MLPQTFGNFKLNQIKLTAETLRRGGFWTDEQDLRDNRRDAKDAELLFHREDAETRRISRDECEAYKGAGVKVENGRWRIEDKAGLPPKERFPPSSIFYHPSSSKKTSPPSRPSL